MRIDILTLFPEMLRSPLEHSILKRAQEAGLLMVRPIDIREFATDRHRTADDTPYGGGAGMVMKPEPIFRAVEHVMGDAPEGEEGGPTRIILMTPQGEPFTQAKARELAQEEHLVLLCGRYEGVDHRVRDHLVDDELSVGDVVLNGGEVAACLVIEAVVRLLPGAMGNEASPVHESFGAAGLLEEPIYTRPADFRGWEVPEILLSGDHGRIERDIRAACKPSWMRSPTQTSRPRRSTASSARSTACRCSTRPSSRRSRGCSARTCRWWRPRACTARPSAAAARSALRARWHGSTAPRSAR